MIDTTRENVERVARECDGRVCYASTNAEWPNRALQEAAALLLALVERAENGEAMLSTMRPFFEKHALGPKAKPSCLVCGRNDYESVAIAHMELPGIVVCALCKKAEADLAQLKKHAEALRNRLAWEYTDGPLVDQSIGAALPQEVYDYDAWKEGR